MFANMQWNDGDLMMDEVSHTDEYLKSEPPEGIDMDWNDDAQATVMGDIKVDVDWIENGEVQMPNPKRVSRRFANRVGMFYMPVNSK